MGHAGAIIRGNTGTAKSKIQALENANVFIAKTASEIGIQMCRAMSEHYGKICCSG